MEAHLLFRKKAALTEDGLDWLRGSETFAAGARRDTTGRVAVSAILVRALLAALDGHLLQALYPSSGPVAQVTSKTTPGAAAWCWREHDDVYLPNGEAEKITYHLGMLFIVEALAAPNLAADFWAAYRTLKEAWDEHGRHVEIKTALVVAADELYYFGRYFDSSDTTGGGPADRFAAWTVDDALKATPPTGGRKVNLRPLTDTNALDALLRERRPHTKAKPSGPPVSPSGRFIGWQLQTIVRGLQAGFNLLLAGPTRSGKTVAVEEALLALNRLSFFVAGKEGLQDLDVLGALLPDADRPGQLRWTDGPLTAAMRAACFEPVVLVVEEINRIRPEHLNVVLDAMNPRPGALLRRQGLSVDEALDYFVVELPLTAEKVACPSSHLQWVATGNFGTGYQTYALDPAVRGRFQLALDFDYLNLDDELQLIIARTGIAEPVAHALCLVARNSRDLHRRGELPGVLDTAGLLIWAQLCAQCGARTIADLARTARLVWGDVVGGRDHLGLAQTGKLAGLFDELAAKCALPEGDVNSALTRSRLDVWSSP
jgi:hypothetical protein